MECGIGKGDCHFLLVNDIAGVRLCHHIMQCRTGFGFSVYDRPVYRNPAAVVREVGTMQVKGTARGHIQHFTVYHVPVVERKKKVRRNVPYPHQIFRLVD